MNLERIAPMQAIAVQLAEGDAGTAQTIRTMRRLIEEGKKDPAIHALAAKILNQYHAGPEYTPEGESAAAYAVYDSVLRNVRYTPDVTGKETLHSARQIVQLRIGDCDDFVILICSLMETIGKRTRIVTISAHDEDPKQFSHVFPEVLIGGKWVPMDAARKHAAFARGPEHWFRRREWDTQSDSYVDVSGLNGYSRRQAMGYQPAMLPRAYRTNTQPNLRRLRGRAPLGQGNYGARAIRRLSLGQDTLSPADVALIQSADPYALAPAAPAPVNYGAIAPIITAGATGAANIIAASRASPYNLVPTTSLSAPGPMPNYPYGMVPSGISPFGSSIFGAGQLRGSTLLFLGLGAVAVIALASRR